MDALERFFAEDWGVRGDATTKAVLGAHARRRVRARVFAREPLVAAGLIEAVDVFDRVRVTATPAVREGRRVRAGATLLDLAGPVGAVLGAERLALNIVGRMSGIATQTRRLQDLVGRVNPLCRVAATRKTTPGFRAYEKRAVALGGGDPHRYGLYDAILVKDNHIDAVGSVATAVRRALAYRPRLVVEAEAGSIAQAVEAARAGADWVLLDNMSPSRARQAAAAARKARPGVLVECSGRLSEGNLARYAPFADRLSLGRLTHSASSADVSLELRTRRPAPRTGRGRAVETAGPKPQP